MKAASWPFSALIAVLTVTGAGMVVVGAREPGPPPQGPDVTGLPISEQQPTQPAPATRLPTASASSTTGAPRTARVLARSVPVTLDIPAIKVHSRVIGVGLRSDGTVEVPPLEKDSPAGWYRYLATPGERGPAVILGHVDTAGSGPAVFYRLGQLRRGDRIRVTRKDGSVVVFAVRSVNRVPKSNFPSAAVYGPTRAAELRLVTCGGDFDRSRRSYQDNIIVFATAAVGR